MKKEIAKIAKIAGIAKIEKAKTSHLERGRSAESRVIAVIAGTYRRYTRISADKTWSPRFGNCWPGMIR